MVRQVRVHLLNNALRVTKAKRINYLARVNPLIAVIFPVVYLYAQNIDEVPFTTALAVMLAAVLGGLVFGLAARLALRNDGAASFVSVVWLVLFFSHGHILDSVSGASIGGLIVGRVRYLLAVEIVIALTAVVIALRARSFCHQTVPFISVALLIPFLFTWTGVGLYHLGPSDNTDEQASGIQGIAIPEIHPDQLPDIYYIILDSYPREDVLWQIHGYDNSWFIRSLEEKGFFIGSQSRSNYTQTSLSLSSSLNMDYLHRFHAVNRSVDSTDETILRELIQDNRVVSIVQEMGYRFAFLNSPWGLTMVNPRADSELSTRAYPLGTFGRLFLRPVLGNDFGYFFSRTILIRHFVDRLFNLFAADLFGAHLEQLNKISKVEEATFTFAHLLPPHPPYVFDRDGNTSSSGFFARSYRDTDAYVEQLIWVNKSMEKAVERILQDSDGKAIIVIQGDHGTEASDVRHVLSHGGNPDETLIFEKTGILNAYYLPDMCQPAGLYKSITPVNTFRLIFDRCLGTDLGLLEDELYWSTYDRPYDFKPVDEVVRYQGSP